MNNSTILDTIMQNRRNDGLTNFNPMELVKTLFSTLNEREKEVLSKRFGIIGNPHHTLESIGKNLGITRERVRQIEISSINKIKKEKDTISELKRVETHIKRILEQYSGIMAQYFMIETILSYIDEYKDNENILKFIITKIFNDRIVTVDSSNKFLPYWKLANRDEDEAYSITQEILNILDSEKQTLEHKALVDLYKSKKGTAYDELAENILINYLHLAKETKQDIFGNWGIVGWHTVTPKRMSDKIYIVLKQYKKPMHFTEIATVINKIKFDKKIAYPATVHNELILNDKYVLIGRGIYALKEWGYKPGVVADVIYRILEEKGPLTRDEIVKSVLDQRMVGKSTVHLALMNKDKFKKVGNNKYHIV